MRRSATPSPSSTSQGQTITTAGYGASAPKGVATNLLAAFHAVWGVLGFRPATGLLDGRLSNPPARIRFSVKRPVAPYEERTALPFRGANARANILMEHEAKVLPMTVEGGKRNFSVPSPERPRVYHPIDEASPLYQKTGSDPMLELDRIDDLAPAAVAQP